MGELYNFKHKEMEFSKDGSLDELIALDRYTVPTYEGYKVGDTVVAIVDDKDSKKVGTIKGFKDNDVVVVCDRQGDTHDVKSKLLHKPLELKPHQLWERWAKGGASVESDQFTRLQSENAFRKLLDGFRYSLGGRIQLMLGQHEVFGLDPALTAYNCFVSASPESSNIPLQQFLGVLEIGYKQALIHRAGGGDGINLSTIQTVEGSNAKEENFIFYLSESHPDYSELQDRIKLGKFKGVTVVSKLGDFQRLMKEKNAVLVNAVDSVKDGLFDNLKNMTVHSYEGKTVAIDFTSLRERNAIVHGVNGRSSGAVSWMELFVLVAGILQLNEIDAVDFAEIFSFIVNLIQQGGSRRGALMLILQTTVDKKLILKFITRKQTAGYLQGANVSVGIDEQFMTRVKLGQGIPFDEIKDRYIKDAVEVWNEIIHSAWKSAEPGVVWLERYNLESNSWYFSPIVATNPCGEQGLPPWGVCNLGHHVLPVYFSYTGAIRYLVSDKNSRYFFPKHDKLKKYDVNWDSLAEGAQTAVRLQDNIIDYTPYFLKENADVQLSERRVGIGSMGLGTLLIKLGLRYGSPEALEFADVLYSFIAYQSYKASIMLAKEKGAFPNFVYEKFIQSGFMKRLLSEFPDLDEILEKYGIRNVTLLTQAPTGSTATYIDNIPLFVKLFGGVSTGIEPYFAFEFYRASRLGQGFMQVMEIAQQYMQENGLTSLDELPDYFVTAMELQPIEHVLMQASVQKWTDSSISKTANCPNDYTIEQTADLYMLAYDNGLKGMTIYRDGSRTAQVLSINKEDAKLESHIEAEKLAKIKNEEAKTSQVEDDKDEVPHKQPKKRPERLFGFTDKIRVMGFNNEMVKVYVTINVDDEGNPWEVFMKANDAILDSYVAVIGRQVTQFLRYGDTVDNLAHTVKHLRQGQNMVSLPARLASLLEQVAYGKIKVPVARKTKKKMTFQKCPDCGEIAYDKANCICTACGSSHCN